MFENALTREQIALAGDLFPKLSGFYLAGGTALALQMGHRRSLDFDLACSEQINPFDLERKLISNGFKIEQIFTSTTDEFSILIRDTNVTFFYFPFDVGHHTIWARGQIKMPEIIDLGAMKAYALGRRNQWKDYVDLYFLLKFKLTLENLIARASKIFSSNFNEKLFREQLCYFEDIDLSETIDYLDYAPDDKEIKEFLGAVAIKI